MVNRDIAQVRGDFWDLHYELFSPEYVLLSESEFEFRFRNKGVFRELRNWIRVPNDARVR
jgi:hypothetical protein